MNPETLADLPLYISLFGIIVLLPSLYQYHKDLQDEDV